MLNLVEMEIDDVHIGLSKILTAFAFKDAKLQISLIYLVLAQYLILLSFTWLVFI